MRRSVPGWYSSDELAVRPLRRVAGGSIRSQIEETQMSILHVASSQHPPSALADHVVVRHPGGRHARAFQFGPFLLQPEQQRLLNLGMPVRIGGRALDLLTLLVERAGEIVGKQELISRAWPDTFVEETNLKVNIAGLRRVLGERHRDSRFVATVVGRGYRFIAPVEELALTFDGDGWRMPSRGW
jgi:DNA-binding winged helix-turn-helix (wHTH) protein